MGRVQSTRIVVVMGVSGAGKSTVGRALARELGWTFLDADDVHPAANVERMARGEPLSERDREPWLTRLAERIREHLERDEPLVLACSALKEAHRERLAVAPRAMCFVHLDASPDVLRRRLESRRGHRFGADLLASQLEALEPPADALWVDAAEPVDALVRRIRAGLRLGP